MKNTPLYNHIHFAVLSKVDDFVTLRK